MKRPGRGSQTVVLRGPTTMYFFALRIFDTCNMRPLSRMLPRDFRRDTSDILVTCPKGLSDSVRSEIVELGMEVSGQFYTGVRTRGTLHDCIILNLSLSTAHHVLYQVLAQTCATPDELYTAVSSLDWEHLIPLDTTLTVTSTVKTASITDTRYANLQVQGCHCRQAGVKDRQTMRQRAT